MFVNDKSFRPSGQDMDLGFGRFRFKPKVTSILPPLHSIRELATENIMYYWHLPIYDPTASESMLSRQMSAEIPPEWTV